MSNELRTILLALGLSVVVAFTGCDSDDDDETTITQPNAPTGVTATFLASDVVRIGWTASALDDAPTGYKVERRTAESEWDVLAELNAETTAYNDSTIEAAMNYHYRVGAFNSGGTTYNETNPTISTFNMTLLGVWDAPDPSQAGEGVDSVSIIFDFNLTFGGFIYRRTEHYQSFDLEDVEEGVYVANGSTVTWNGLRANGVEIDTSYTWNYNLNPNGEELVVEFNNGVELYDIDFVLASPPVD